MTVLIGAVLLLLVPPVALLWRSVGKEIPRHARSAFATPTSRVVSSLVSALLLSTLVQLAFTLGKPTEQAFASFGAIKKITLPIIYMLFACAVAVSTRVGHVENQMVASKVAPARSPWWWRAFLIASVVSAAAELVAYRQPLVLSSVAQGWLLLGGVLLFCYAGVTASAWTAVQQRAMFIALLLAAVLECSTRNSMGVFVASTFPASVVAVYAALKHGSRRFAARWALGLVGGIVCTIQALRLFTDPTSSTAERMQFAVCVLLISLAAVPRRLRSIVGPIVLVVAIVGVAQSGLGSLMRGHYDGVTDVTLEQRGYETAQVLADVKTNPISWLFGMGPGGTVDLSACPDWATLLAAGRYLPAVDDVHLLSSWIILKMGFVGLTLFATMVGAGIWEIGSLLRLQRITYFDLLLMCLFGAGLVMALPAATHFFANPMPTLALGVMYARRQHRRTLQPV